MRGVNAGRIPYDVVPVLIVEHAARFAAHSSSADGSGFALFLGFSRLFSLLPRVVSGTKMSRFAKRFAHNRNCGSLHFVHSLIRVEQRHRQLADWITRLKPARRGH